MTAGATYTPIATTTLGSATASYTFSSIPSTYTDLVLIVNGTSVVDAANIVLQFNGDTGTNYSVTAFEGTGSVAQSTRSLNATYVWASYYVGGSSAVFTGIVNAQIMNYANTTTYKTIISRSNNAYASSTYPGTEAVVNLWRNTAAINSIKVFTNSGANIMANSTLTLYGIASA